jgi:hypothetical protein
MPRVWWCNQTRCWDDERPAGLVCSHVDPTKRAQKFRRMVSEARAGDITVHYRSGRWMSVVALSRALTDAVEGLVDLREYGVTRTACWHEPSQGWRFEADYFDLTSPIPKSAIIDELDGLEIDDGPIAPPGQIRLGYFLRFSNEGLSILRRATDEAWPGWAEAACAPQGSESSYYFYNTDSASLVEPRPRYGRLIEHAIAAAGGERSFGENFDVLAPGDTLLMYENGIGVVAVGTVQERWDRQSHRDLLYYVSAAEIGEHGHEYRINVDWFLDLSAHPIDLEELKQQLGYAPRGALRKIVSARAAVEKMIAERLAGTQRTPPAEIGESVRPPPERVRCTTTRIVRDTAEARRLKQRYKYRCQICKERIELGFGSFYTEIHHIRPLGGEHRGLDVPGNMLVVCPTHHAMLDLGVTTFRDDQSVLIYGIAHPLVLKHQLASENLNYHNEHIANRAWDGNRVAWYGNGDENSVAIGCSPPA